MLFSWNSLWEYILHCIYSWQIICEYFKKDKSKSFEKNWYSRHLDLLPTYAAI